MSYRYRVLKRIDTGEVSRDGRTFVYKVFQPKGWKGDSASLGVPTQWQRPGTFEIMAVKLEVNSAGWITFPTPASKDLLEWGSVEPRNKPERDVVENFARGRSTRVVIPTL
jgi:hypothetical protein